MYNHKFLTLTLFAALIAVIMSACSKDEPSVSMEITTEVGNSVSQYPYDYAEATITFSCSEDYLELSLPTFAILSNNNAEVITPARGDFKISNENTIVFLVENGDTIKHELPVYKYSFNVKLEGSDGAFLVFALSALNDDFEQNVREGLEVYRGYSDIEISAYCPDGQYTMSNACDLSNIFGYKGVDNIAITLLNLYSLYNQIPTLGIEYKPSDNGNNAPDFNIGAKDFPYSEVLDYFNGLNPTEKINGSYSFGIDKDKSNEIINQFGRLLRNRNGISLDIFSDFE